MKTVKNIFIFILIIFFVMIGVPSIPTNKVNEYIESQNVISNEIETESVEKHLLSNIPEFSNKPYIEINGNVPYFTEEEIVVESFEQYDSLDQLGRCTKATACLGKDLMPTEPRE